MRVLLVSDVYFPRINGVSSSVQTFLRGISRSESHIEEAFLIAPDYGIHWDDEGHNVIRVRSYPTPGDHEDRLMYGHEIRKLIPRLQKQNFDVVHIQTFGIAFYEGVKIAKKLNLPVILTYHTHFEEYLPHYISFSPTPVTRFCCHQLAVWQCNAVDSVVVPSHEMAKVLKDSGVRSRMSIVPTGIDSALFRDADGPGFRRKHGIDPNRLVLLFVGRVAPEKNVDFLIRMLGKVVVYLPDVALVIAGGGQDMENCQDLASSLGLKRNVLFVGWLDREAELLDCYNAADVFVFASRTETQGLALLEALALGIPVVSTSYLGSSDTVQQGHGAVISPEDEELFALEVFKLLGDSSRMIALSKEARKYTETCLVGPMVQRLSRVYNVTEISTEPLYQSFQRGLWEGIALFFIVFYTLLERLQGKLIDF